MIAPLPVVTVASPGIHGNQQQFVSAPVPVEWWKDLRSDKLTHLIDQALQASPTLAAAQATLRQAQEVYAAQAGSTLYPRIDANLSG